jgi:hypothetical protein
MSYRTAFMIFCFGFAGCATEPHTAQKTTTLSASASIQDPNAQNSSVRVNLPYVYTRHGVEVRVYSVEFSSNQVIVTTVLQEMRGVAIDLDAALFLKAQTSTGEPLGFAGAKRGDAPLDSAILHFNPKEQISVALSYQLGASNENNVELHFPTGKWWSSVRDRSDRS